MPTELWVAFVAASWVLLVVPGPTILTVISYAIVHGRQATPALVAGVALGDSTALTVSVFGLGALLAASSQLFTVIKIAGGAYLLYLGLKMLKSGVSSSEMATRVVPGTRRRVFLNTYLVTALNPKSILFFVAFLPQFVDPNASTGYQLGILAVTFVVMAALNAGAYSFFAASANRVLNSPSARRPLNLAGGTLLSVAGLWALVARHSA